MPVTSTRSPGRTVSTRSSKMQTATFCGVSPSGTSSGVSWSFRTWRSENLHSLWTIWKEWLAPQPSQRVGSSMVQWLRATGTSFLQSSTVHRNTADIMSGTRSEQRITMPLSVMRRSMSQGFMQRMILQSFSSREWTCTWQVPRSSGSTRSSRTEMFHSSRSKIGMTSVGKLTRWSYKVLLNSRMWHPLMGNLMPFSCCTASSHSLRSWRRYSASSEGRASGSWNLLMKWWKSRTMLASLMSVP
mmetsp:Transcript_42329/g.122456  ORF Transcript_42329/g.122456 Transcript_42329/m.122456 type:complete len:244 (+) Transcript_42329:1649-2380(+)